MKVIIKINFQKAYNHVDWDFLDTVMDKKGFGINGEFGCKNALGM